MHAFLQVLLLIVGFAMLVKGADWFVDGAAGIAKKFGIPSLVIGLTIVAMGTSAPEAAISITAAVNHNAGISIGNVVGSNILNILIILGIASVITPLAVQKSTRRYEIPFVILVSLVLLWQGWDQSVGRIDGAVLWVLFIIYLIYMGWLAKQGRNGAEDMESFRTSGSTVGGFAVAKNPAQVAMDTVMPLWKALLLTLVGLVLIVFGARFTVNAASELARMAGVSERFIGLTIVALGTSLPELFTSVNAARKGEADIAVGNIVGSNIFNILFVLGTSALIMPVAFEPKFRIDAIVAVAAAVLLWILSLNKDKKLKRSGGIIMLVAYALYFVYLVLK